MAETEKDRNSWFKKRRLEFILATLKQFGQFHRSCLVKEFEISEAQAAIDIKEFLLNAPPEVRYDVRMKMYIFDNEVER